MTIPGIHVNPLARELESMLQHGWMRGFFAEQQKALEVLSPRLLEGHSVDRKVVQRMRNLCSHYALALKGRERIIPLSFDPGPDPAEFFGEFAGKLDAVLAQFA